MYYAALMIDGHGHGLVLAEVEGDTFEKAEEWIDALLQSDDCQYDECLWIADIRDLSNLAQFFGKHRDEFAVELGG